MVKALFRLFILTIIFFPHQTFAQQSKSKTTNARIAEKDRDIQLPEHDAHFDPIRTYVENVPDSDYFHASANAYESFNDIKFAVRIHWGIYSIWQMNHESWGFLELSDQKKQEYQNLYKSFNPVGFNAEEWMDLFDRAGIKCFAFTSKHHDGFSMFDTKTRVKERANYTAANGPTLENSDVAYSIIETPFKRDIVKELCDAGHKHHLKIDLYFSHPDWYDADFRPYNNAPIETPDSKVNPYTHYGDSSNFESSHSNFIVPDPSQAEIDRMMARHRAQLKELLTNYGKIDMICLDQYLGPRVWPYLKETMKELRKIQPDVMFRCRGIGNYGDYYTPETFVPGSKENTKMPWMTIDPLASTFSYDSAAANYKGSKYIILNLIDAVAKGGSYMIGIGPDGNGKFHPAAVKQLEETGKWLRTNGAGIYGTRAANVWHEGDKIRFTVSKDKKHYYAFSFGWPGKTLTLKTFAPAKNSNVYLFGYAQPLKWESNKEEMTIHLPDALPDSIKENVAFGFQLEGEQKKDDNVVTNGDFSIGEPGKLPQGWSTWAKRPTLMPSFKMIEDEGGQGKLMIEGTGKKDIVGLIKTEAPVVLGKTYLFSVRFKISADINPQRNLLFQIWAPNNDDGIFNFVKKEDGWVEGTQKITLTGKGDAKADVRVLFRFSDTGKVIVSNVSLKETTPDPPRWVRVACTSGIPDFKTLPTLIAKAAQEKADLLLLPEYVNSDSNYETLNGKTCTLMSTMAAKYHMYIAGGIVRKVDEEDRLYNTVVLYDREGKFAGMYDKIHPYSPEVNEEGITPGKAVQVLKTDFGKLGFITCYDSWFTDVAELVALKGAELVIFPNAGYYRSLIPARAADNRIRIVASSLYDQNGIWDTGGEDVSHPNKDSTSYLQAGKPYKNTVNYTFGKMKLLVSSLDLNCTPMPHYNGGTMMASPGGTRNRREQLYYLDDDIKKEKERWWSEEK